MSQGRFKIHGDVGQLVTVGPGATANIYINTPTDTQDCYSTFLLLRKCERAGIKPTIQRISYTLYGTGLFKSLSPEQLATLNEIADEIIEVLLCSRGM